MLAVHLESGKVGLRRRPRPRRGPGTALIRLQVGGICNTDLELQKGYYGFAGTPGHEFVGEVVAADDAGLLGKRVVGEINVACRKCAWCHRGLGRHCPKRSVLGIVGKAGAFQELFTLPEANLHIVPPAVSTRAAAFVEPLAAACEILEQARIAAGSEVAVLGDGKLGLLASQALVARGMRVHQYGRHREKLRVAASAGVVTELVRARVPLARYDWVVEATGSPGGLKHAVSMTRPRGTVFLKSTIHDAVPIDLAPVIVNEITLVGSRCGRFEPALALLKSGKINVDDMIAGEFPLTRASAAFARAAEPGVLKVLLKG